MESVVHARYKKKSKRLKCVLLIMTLMIVALSLSLRYRAIKQVVVTYTMALTSYFNKNEYLEEKKPVAIQLQSIQAPDRAYKYITLDKDALYRGNLILINKDAPCKFQEQDELVYLNKLHHRAYKIEEKQYLNKTMAKMLNKMLVDFRKATNKKDIIVTSGYRSLEAQEQILNEKVDNLGDTEAIKWAMLPGYSEHHSGYAVDIGIYTDDHIYISYKGQEPYNWINEHCFEYGIIRRYAEDKSDLTGISNEAWHYRYVGIPHAYIMRARDMCLEEYIDYLRNFTYDKQHLIADIGKEEYEIYFVPAQAKAYNIPVPENMAYSLSGNNMDGFIVTCHIEK